MIIKKLKYLSLIGLLSSSPLFAEPVLFEDFSGPISIEKFWNIERSVQIDTSNQVLTLSSKAKSESPAYPSNRVSLKDTGTTLLQADLSVTELSLGNSDTQNAMLSIEGVFYNSNSVSPTDRLGDVFVRLALGDRGNGPEAWYELQVSQDADFNTSDITTGSFGNITLGTVYPVSITYDGDNSFSFTFNNGSTVSADGPEKLANSFSPTRTMRTQLRFGQINSTPDSFDEGAEDGTPASVAGTVDNVATDAGLVDDFSSNKLDQAIWGVKQNSTIVENGALVMKATGQGEREDNRLFLKTKNTNTFGATVKLLSSSTVNDTARIRARIEQILSNDTYDVNNGDSENGWEGTIWTQFLIQRSNGLNRVAVYAERAGDADWTVSEELFFENLGTINLDQDYDLLIEKTGTLVEYKLDGVVVHSFDLATDHSSVLSGNDFTPVGDVEPGFRVRIQDDAGEVHAVFDNIIVDDSLVASSSSSSGSSGGGAINLLLLLAFAGLPLLRRARNL